MRTKTRGKGVPFATLCASLESSQRVARVPGKVVFLKSDPDLAPSALRHNLKHNYVLHEQNLAPTVRVSTRPRIAGGELVRIARPTHDFAFVDVTFGYLKPPNLP